jgi:hypothetical protein
MARELTIRTAINRAGIVVTWRLMIYLVGKIGAEVFLFRTSETEANDEQGRSRTQAA